MSSECGLCGKEIPLSIRAFECTVCGEMYCHPVDEHPQSVHRENGRVIYYRQGRAWTCAEHMISWDPDTMEHTCLADLYNQGKISPESYIAVLEKIAFRKDEAMEYYPNI